MDTEERKEKEQTLYQKKVKVAELESEIEDLEEELN